MQKFQHCSIMFAMLETQLDLYNQNTLPSASEFEKKFPDKYLWLDLIALEAEFDLDTIPDIEVCASNLRKSQKNVVGTISKEIVDFSNLVVQEHPDTIILLDKSARPISHLLRTLWREVYPECSTPNIRFINIGREASTKYRDESLLSQLYGAHSKFINNKKVIIADEFALRGESISRARDTILNVFPDVKSLQCTIVFEDSQFWFHPSFYMGLGVFDEIMPMDILAGASEADRQDTFFAKTVPGVARRCPMVKNQSYYKDTLKSTHEAVDEFRDQLGYLAKIIAKNCRAFPKDNVFIKPKLPFSVSHLNKST